jgi:site-specific DNA recombinase
MVYTPVEPIISEELWRECNGILTERREKNKRPARKAVHLFSGLAFCTCGTKMYVPSNTPN